MHWFTWKDLSSQDSRIQVMWLDSCKGGRALGLLHENLHPKGFACVSLSALKYMPCSLNSFSSSSFFIPPKGFGC